MSSTIIYPPPLPLFLSPLFFSTTLFVFSSLLLNECSRVALWWLRVLEMKPPDR